MSLLLLRPAFCYSLSLHFLAVPCLSKAFFALLKKLGSAGRALRGFASERFIAPLRFATSLTAGHYNR
jgi:hypothetical protein